MLYAIAMGQIKPFFNIYGTLYATIILACRYAPREIVDSTRAARFSSSYVINSRHELRVYKAQTAANVDVHDIQDVIVRTSGAPTMSAKTDVL